MKFLRGLNLLNRAAVATILFLFSIAPAGGQRDSSGVRLMTFNIRYGTAADGDNSWTHRKDLLLQVVRDYSPDILGLQEALRFQLDEIRESLEEYKEIGAGRDDGKTRGEYCAILYRSSRFSVEKQGTFWFSKTPSIPGSKHWGNEIPRICTWATFRSNGLPFVVYNLHLDHESQVSREESVHLLMRTIQKQDTVPVIVMGDFNAGEDNAAIEFVRNEDFLDTFRSLHPVDPLAGTYHGFTGNRRGAKIDYIFVNRFAESIDAAIVHTKDGEQYPSDHFPVTAVVRFFGSRKR